MPRILKNLVVVGLFVCVFSAFHNDTLAMEEKSTHQDECNYLMLPYGSDIDDDVKIFFMGRLTPTEEHVKQEARRQNGLFMSSYVSGSDVE